MSSRNKQLLALFLFIFPFINTDYLVSKLENYRSDEQDFDSETLRDSLNDFRERQAQSFLAIIILALLAILVVHFFSDIKLSRILLIQIPSMILLSQSVLGRLGWEIETWAGGSLVERLNEWWFRICYSVGTFLFFITLVS